jgi:hypothetical protein
MCQKCQLCKYLPLSTNTVKQTQIDKLNFQFTLGQILFPVFFEANCSRQFTNKMLFAKNCLNINILHLITIDLFVSHLYPAARQFCRSTYTITDNTIK